MQLLDWPRIRHEEGVADSATPSTITVKKELFL